MYFEGLEQHWDNCDRIEYCKICDLLMEANNWLQEKETM